MSVLIDETLFFSVYIVAKINDFLKWNKILFLLYKQLYQNKKMEITWYLLSEKGRGRGEGGGGEGERVPWDPELTIQENQFSLSCVSLCRVEQDELIHESSSIAE